VATTKSTKLTDSALHQCGCIVATQCPDTLLSGSTALNWIVIATSCTCL